MTAINRTAYPYFKPIPNSEELAELYTPTAAELELAHSKVRLAPSRLSFLVLLKSFQRLGYFPRPEVIPDAVITHIRKFLNLKDSVSAIAPEASRYRYYRLIRQYLKVKPYSSVAKQVAAKAIEAAVGVMDHPTDLINVAVETLVKESYELPAFGTLERLAKHLRTLNHTELYRQVSSQLNPVERDYLDGLITRSDADVQAMLNRLKSAPKSEKLTHLVQLQQTFDELMSFGDAQRLLKGVNLLKLKHLAAYAKTLDITEFRDINVAKRRTLLLCLLYRAQVKMRDHLVEMLLKRMRKIDASARRRLVELREKHLARTERLLGLFSQTLSVAKTETKPVPFHRSVQTLLTAEGGADALLAECEEVRAYNSQNHLSLMWRFYSPFRRRLFDLLRLLDIQSASEDSTLMEALALVLAHQHKRHKHLPAEIDLSFMSVAWRQLVIANVDGQQKLVRQHLEVCVFAALAVALKTGDAYVTGSEEYADFRAQLLPWEACEQSVAEYCEQLGIPATADGFVEHLKAKLIERSAEVDSKLQGDDQLSFNEEGDPVLKKVPAAPIPQDADKFAAALDEQMPERTVLDILCNVEHWLNWTRHLGPLSGSEPKIADAPERYILTAFAYGCN
ncbi:MAG: DUF4158 domain-containing protein, partial [Phormidesmis sp.]